MDLKMKKKRSDEELLRFNFWIGVEATRLNASDVFKVKNEYEFAKNIEAGNVEKIKQCAKDINVNARGEIGINFLQWALLKQRIDSFKRLLELGADPCLYGMEGNSTIHLAANIQNPVYLKEILRLKVDLNVLNEKTRATPLLNAIVNGANEQAIDLLRAGADPNLADELGDTPLHAAAITKNTQVSILLIEKNANPFLENKKGETFLYYLYAQPEKELSKKEQEDRLKIERCLECSELVKESAFKMGSFFEEKIKDNKKAFYWFQMGAEAGCSQSMLKVALFWYWGLHKEPNLDLAFELMNKLARLSKEAEAFRWLGFFYETGMGCDEDLGLAHKYYKLGAEGGSKDAQAATGVFYAYGKGCEVDFKKAIYWYNEAAKQNCSEGYYQLGVMLGNGHGFKNEKVAWNCLIKAARMGNRKAVDFFKRAHQNFNFEEGDKDLDTGMFIENDKIYFGPEAIEMNRLKTEKIKQTVNQGVENQSEKRNNSSI